MKLTALEFFDLGLIVCTVGVCISGLGVLGFALAGLVWRILK